MASVKLSVLDQSPISQGSTLAAALASSIELAAHADRWGYERYWVAEHHAMNALVSPAPGILLNALSGGRIELGVGRAPGGGPLEAIALPEEAVRELARLAPGPISQTEWPALLIGTPDGVYGRLRDMTRSLGIDEAFVVTITFDPAMRLRSYELLAGSAGLRLGEQ